MAEEPKYFKVERDGAVIIWWFYNPPRNLWDASTGPEFQRLVEEFYRDPGLRVGIFTSAMPDVFIQHYDVSLLVQHGEQLKKEKPAAPPPRRVGFRRDSKPIIAAINANLAGGGLELAMSFDFRFMARGASASQGEVRGHPAGRRRHAAHDTPGRAGAGTGTDADGAACLRRRSRTDWAYHPRL